jgi:hypothetical protein
MEFIFPAATAPVNGTLSAVGQLHSRAHALSQR